MLVSALELAAITTGSTQAESVRRAVRTARELDRLGYHRVWFAEHHGIPSVGCTAPEVLIAAAGAVTSSIRIGSGGVMLPNHAPLAVAERFLTLEALHPGRVDLGVGRAPGSDGRTALALRRSPEALAVDDFPEQLADLRAFLQGDLPYGHPLRGVRALPRLERPPPVFMLGSSDYGAQVAAALGLPYAFAHHINPAASVAALRLYRERFQGPGEPHAILACGVVCGEGDDEALRLASSGALAIARLRTGRPGPLASPQEAREHPWTDAERAVAEAYLRDQVVGSPETVRERVRALAEAAGADELMAQTPVHDESARVRSYELLQAALRDL